MVRLHNKGVGCPNAESMAMMFSRSRPSNRVISGIADCERSNCDVVRQNHTLSVRWKRLTYYCLVGQAGTFKCAKVV
jgi:hypothetical protein